MTPHDVDAAAPSGSHGHGVDLCPVARIAAMRAEHGDRFLSRVFTPDEASYALASEKRADEHLAARFAAKEAVLKAIGCGWSGGVAWTDVEVVRHASGTVDVRLTGRAAQLAADRGIRAWHLSLSHTDRLALASVIACS